MKKNKFLKGGLAAALSLALMLPLAACGGDSGSGDNGGNAGGDNGGSAGGGDSSASYMLGFNTWGAGTPVFDNMANETAFTIQALGSEGSSASDEFMADKELANIQNFISADVDGIVMQCASEPMLPQAAELCKAAAIPFVLPTFVGLDEDRAEVSATNEYYVGSVAANLIMDGYQIGKAALEAGYTSGLLVGGNIGDINMDKRLEGFTLAFVTEGGGTILDTARCTSPAEGQEKASAMLTANPEAEFMYAMGGDYVVCCVSAQDTLGVELPIYASNADSDTVTYIKNGRVVCSTAGNDLASNISVPLLINYLDGHPIKDADGKAPELELIPFIVTADNVDDFNWLFFSGETHPLTEEFLQSLAWRYNENVSYDSFVDLLENGLTVEAMMAAHN